jgi:hypothetical protein
MHDDEKDILVDSPEAIEPPAGLSDEAAALFKQYCEGFAFDAHALTILARAMESFDRMREAQRVIAKEGICIRDRWGQPKQHPATLVERDSRAAFLRALAALHLDVEPIGEMGRPAGS